jgi:WD40 repeat protein
LTFYANYISECLAVLEGRTSLVSILQLQDKTLISAGGDGLVFVWSLEENTQLFSVSAHESAVTCLTCDDSYIFSGGQYEIKMWDLKSGQLLSEVLAGIQGAWCIASDEHNVIACGIRDQETVLEVCGPLISKHSIISDQKGLMVCRYLLGQQCVTEVEQKPLGPLRLDVCQHFLFR